MNKITIATIKKAINECPENIGRYIEEAIEEGDSIWLMWLIQDAVKAAESEASGRKELNARGE